MEQIDSKLNKLMTRLDLEAEHVKRKRFKTTWIAGIICGVLAVISFAIALPFHSFIHNKHSLLGLATLEFSLILISFILLGRFAPKFKNKFLTLRRNAEYLRAIDAVHNSGLKVSGLDIKEPNAFFKISEEVSIIEKEILTSSLQSQVDKQSTDAINEKVTDFLDQQIAYHKTKRIKKYEREYHRNEVFLNLIKALFLIAISVKFALELSHHFHYQLTPSWISPEWLLALTQAGVISFPPIYAAIEGVNYFSEYRRNIKLSKKMVDELIDFKKKLALHDLNQKENLETLGKELRQLLEEENSDWAFRYNERIVEAKI
ncbi:hypothetical protein [Arcticibacterium luteifluviistationis]|uniref:DUF4231 domain-containing protein n=1 Tax=Arcticibacterium luteifluviistationis TaxID=1784714 RepID=A0A2Z4G9S9_9BACT|nr:hypothetical protein [Arcticibacterium luteifluviistationis]AWV97673.1 hypothetical protein DJ013_05640 [Arcticibacterium luteifluviistationis]